MTRREWVILGFTAAYMVGLGGMALARGGIEFIFYTVTMVFFIAGVFVLHRRVGFTVGALGALSVWGLLHMAGGTLAAPGGESGDVLYSWMVVPGVMRYDFVVHSFGFGAATYACWQAVRRHVRAGSETRFGVLALSALAGMGLGTVNEMVEYVATKIDSNHGVGGYENTVVDLMANALGAVVAVVLVRVVWGRKGSAHG